MKQATRLIIFSIGLIFPSFGAQANAKCPIINVDFEKGTVNGLQATSSQSDIVSALSLPCAPYTHPDDGGAFNHGGGVFYGLRNIYFYTFKDIIELRKGFSGTTNPSDIFNKSFDDVKRHFGSAHTELDDVLLFDKPFGCIKFNFSKGFVSKSEIYSESCPRVRDKYFPNLGKSQCESGRVSSNYWNVSWSASGVIAEVNANAPKRSKDTHSPDTKIFDGGNNHNERMLPEVMNPGISIYDYGSKIYYRFHLNMLPDHFHKGEAITYTKYDTLDKFVKYEQLPGMKQPKRLGEIDAYLFIDLKKDKVKLFDAFYSADKLYLNYEISKEDFDLVVNSTDTELAFFFSLDKGDNNIYILKHVLIGDLGRLMTAAISNYQKQKDLHQKGLCY